MSGRRFSTASILFLATVCSVLSYPSWSAEEAGQDTLFLELVSQGKLPAGFSSWLIPTSGDLHGDGCELLVTAKTLPVDKSRLGRVQDHELGSEELVALKLRDREWVWDYSTGYIKRRLNVSELGVAWTVGDTDSDGRDEILTFEGNRLLRHEWSGTAFDVDTITLDGVGIVDQAVVGDIDNDGRNELVVCSDDGMKAPDIIEDPGNPIGYNLRVYESGSTGYSLSWQDSTALGYRALDFMPPDMLYKIEKFESNQNNMLLMGHAQSDVSPTNYDFLVWRDGGLRLERSVVLSNGKIWQWKDYYSWEEEQYSEKVSSRYVVQSFMIGILAPVRWNKKTYLVGYHEYGDPMVTTNHAVVFLEQDTYELLNVSPLEALQADWVLWIDPDGKGKGLLCALGSDYRFYRPE